MFSLVLTECWMKLKASSEFDRAENRNDQSAMNMKKDTVQSWLDAKEVRRMAEGLMAAPVELTRASEKKASGESVSAVEPEGDPDQGDAGEEIEISAPRAAVSSALAAARKVAEGSGMLQRAAGQAKGNEEVVAAAVKTPVKPDVSAAKLDANWDLIDFKVLAKQLSERFSVVDAMVVDGGGEKIWSVFATPSLTPMVKRLAQSAPEAGGLRLKIGASLSLQALAISTRQGRVSIGLAVASPLSDEQLKQVAGLLAI